ncbi:hypothetical protein D3827_10020 [Streptococcus mutans]|uniref:hypothetical protein n=1 Tax=Streptococcus mutans TaxID=1309 RepID=UPI0014554C3D|nr:hypothetical protein [Streptococcus mutans]NLQ60100.1 hypothetical protein [Streptococcus mutans]
MFLKWNKKKVYLIRIRGIISLLLKVRVMYVIDVFVKRYLEKCNYGENNMNKNEMTREDYIQLAACIGRQKKDELFDFISSFDFGFSSYKEAELFKKRVPNSYKERYDEITNEYNRKLEEMKQELFDKALHSF